MRKKSLARQRQEMDQEDRDFGGHWEASPEVEKYDPYGDNSDLETLKKQRSAMTQRLRTLVESEFESPRNNKFRESLEEDIEKITEDILRIEYAARESGKKPRGMGARADSMNSKPHQSRAGGRVPQNREERLQLRDLYLGGLPNTNELDSLKKDRAKLFELRERQVEDDYEEGCNMTEAWIERTTQRIARLEMEQELESTGTRGKGAPTRRQGKEDSSDDESGHHRFGSRRGYGRSTAGSADDESGHQSFRSRRGYGDSEAGSADDKSDHHSLKSRRGHGSSAAGRVNDVSERHPFGPLFSDSEAGSADDKSDHYPLQSHRGYGGSAIRLADNDPDVDHWD